MTTAIDIGFTETVKAIQTRKGSRQAYANSKWQSEITDDLAAYISQMRSVFVSTVNAQGYPYTQHKDGPDGFLHVMDRNTIAFVDFKGNRQFISQGNLQDNPRTFLFMIDFVNRQRIKFWGHSEIIEDDPDLLENSCLTNRPNARALSRFSNLRLKHGMPIVRSIFLNELMLSM